MESIRLYSLTYNSDTDSFEKEVRILDGELNDYNGVVNIKSLGLSLKVDTVISTENDSVVYYVTYSTTDSDGVFDKMKQSYMNNCTDAIRAYEHKIQYMKKVS